MNLSYLCSCFHLLFFCFIKFEVVDYYFFVIVNFCLGRNGAHICCYIAIKWPNDVDVHQGYQLL